MKSKAVLRTIIVTLVVTITSGILLMFIVPAITNNKTSNNEEVIKLKKDFVKYPLKKYLKNQEIELFSYLVSEQQLINKNVYFKENNINMMKLRTFFINKLNDIFKIDIEKYETTLFIKPNIIKNNTEMELIIKWWFANKLNSNIIYNNKKYYDILNISFDNSYLS